MTILYGINNCDTIKKARKWLEEQGIEYTFYNYKKQDVPSENLTCWLNEFGWESVLNKRGTTYRTLDEATKVSLDQTSAHQVLLDNPSMIKRPILTTDDGKTLIGFKTSEYEDIFKR